MDEWTSGRTTNDELDEEMTVLVYASVQAEDDDDDGKEEKKRKG